MRKFAFLLGLLLGGLLIVTPVVAQQGGSTGRDEQFEQQILDRLAQINPAAVPIFQQATLDMDAQRFAEAKRGFEQVLALAPGFPDAERRLSYMENALGNAQAAVEHAQRAVAGDDSAYNHAALAQALLGLKDSSRLKEALSEAQTAARQLPDNADVQLTLLYVAVENNHYALIEQTSRALIRLAPDNPIGHYFAGLMAANNSQWEQAEAELLLAKSQGLDAAEIQRVLDKGVSQEANKQRWLRGAGAFLLGWVVTGAVLFVAGLVLSRLTLIAVRRPRAENTLVASPSERLMRGVYRLVIVLTSLYFYLSIPVVSVVVVGGAVGVVWFILSAGVISAQIALIVGAVLIAALVTVYVLIRSLFFRLREDEPGRKLSRVEAPPLWTLAESVAQIVHTRPIDVIYVTPGVEVGVSERGNLLKKLRGTSQRRLVLGLGALPDMTQSQFQAILAHEYGHFLNRDPAGGNLAQQVRGSIYRLVFGLARSGQAVWYNPAWLFINGFYRLFFHLTEGASRLQEIMADRQAASMYGVQNFVDGLLHIVKRDLLFQWQVNAEVERTAQAIGPLSNLYTLPQLESGEARQEIDTALTKIIERPTSPYDSHPSVHDRVELVKRLEANAPLGSSNSTPAWDLLPNAAELQQAMTSLVQRNVDAVRAKQSLASPPVPAVEESPTPIEAEATNEDWECEVCGVRVPADASFCPKCGAAFIN